MDNSILMKKQIISKEFERMQKLAGIITESQLNEVGDEDLKKNIDNLKDSDIHWSKDEENGLSISYNWDDVDEKLLLTQILNLIKKVNPNADLEKKKQSLSGSNILAQLSDKLYAASQKSFSSARGLKDYFEDNLEIFR
jgi:hypothetical protein